MVTPTLSPLIISFSLLLIEKCLKYLNWSVEIFISKLLPNLQPHPLNIEHVV